MNDYDRQRMVEQTLYVLNATGGLDYYRLFKVLYFAQMEHVATWGVPMVPDEFVAYKYGPVPVGLYNAIKLLGSPDASALASALATVVVFAGDDAPTVMVARREADSDMLSTSQKEALDKSIAENAPLSFSQLMHKSHDAAWKRAHDKRQGAHSISTVDMARVAGADGSMLEYVQQQARISSALR